MTDDTSLSLSKCTDGWVGFWKKVQHDQSDTNAFIAAQKKTVGVLNRRNSLPITIEAFVNDSFDVLRVVKSSNVMHAKYGSVFLLSLALFSAATAIQCYSCAMKSLDFSSECHENKRRIAQTSLKHYF